MCNHSFVCLVDFQKIFSLADNKIGGDGCEGFDLSVRGDFLADIFGGKFLHRINKNANCNDNKVIWLKLYT